MRTLSALTVVLLLLCACGNKGELFIPPAAPPPAEEPTDEEGEP